MRTSKAVRALGVAATALLLVGLLAAPAAAVPYGQPDEDNDYPFVAALQMIGSIYVDDVPVAQDVVLGSCTGSLIAETTVLTAAHCVDEQVLTVEELADLGVDDVSADETTEIRIVVNAVLATFAPDSFAAFFDTGDFVVGIPAAVHPGWDWQLGSPDVALVQLLQRPDVEPAAYVSEVGALAELATARGHQDQSMTVVGYGAQYWQTGAVLEDDPETGEPIRPPVTRMAVVDGWRHVGDVRNGTMQGRYGDDFIAMSGNPGRWSGGACHGDSGGPVIHGEGDAMRIVGVVSFGGPNLICRGNQGHAYRLDTEDAQTFLTEHLASAP